MAKMRATLRKVAQVTPPPSPKNGEVSEWSSRLRNHSKPANGRKPKPARIKNEDCSRSTTPSPICKARTRQISGDVQNYWPRRSQRLIGIPAEVEESESETSSSEEESTLAKKTKEALLVESQHYMHYRSKASGSCRNIRPPEALIAEPPLPENVDQVQFSFEIVPSGTVWYETFLRDEQQLIPEEMPSHPAPFLLPYEMSLEAILKSNKKPVAIKKPKVKRDRTIISTRLQMQTAAKQSQMAAESHRKASWFHMPRKSPRCHASTMAILCSKSDDDDAPILPQIKAEPPVGDLVQALEDMLIQDLERRPIRKRGRPPKRKCHNPPGETVLVDTPLAGLLSTPLDRIDDIVDERLIEQEICLFNDEIPLEGWNDVVYLESASASRSSSIYETASEIESTSTCDSRRKANRRKRPNMTGWPRSKKRRPPVQLNVIVDDDLSDDTMPTLSPIGEEPDAKRFKPFQFQRKTLRFVGKRILRPAAQRHAPQRLEYWPCFAEATANRRRKRKSS